MTPAELLERRIDDYRLEIDGVEVWTPYWINWDLPPYFTGAPYRGKGTPGQLASVAQRLLSHDTTQPSDSAAMQSWMRQHGLGVDCSGLVYYVLDGYLRSLGHGPLAKHLIVRRSEIVDALNRHPERRGGLSDADIVDEQSLESIGSWWHKDPRQITSVARLCDQSTAVRIKVVADMRPGDLIRLTTPQGDHLGIIYRVERLKIYWAHSRDTGSDDGGVTKSQIRITMSDMDLDGQDWPQRVYYHPNNGNDGVWRLKPLV